MKELTIEEKAQRYDEALKRARKLYNSEETSADVEIACENIFSELKEEESEDERIRKEIINYFGKGKEYLSLCSIGKDDILAWLEKQGEPIEINPNEFELRLNRLLKQFESLPKEELIDSLSFYLNVVQNNRTYKPDEKQDEQETLCNKCKKEQPSHSCQDITELGRCAVEHEQKSADKVEPKFKNW